jgi:hypothetical protein
MGALTVASTGLEHSSITALVQRAEELVATIPDKKPHRVNKVRALLKPVGLHRAGVRTGEFGRILARFHGPKDFSYYGDYITPATDGILRTEFAAAVAIAFAEVRVPEWESFPRDIHMPSSLPRMVDEAPRLAVMATALLVPRNPGTALMFATDFHDFATELFAVADGAHP